MDDSDHEIYDAYDPGDTNVLEMKNVLGVTVDLVRNHHWDILRLQKHLALLEEQNQQLRSDLDELRDAS